MSGSVLHKNHNPPLPNFRVIDLCLFFILKVIALCFLYLKYGLLYVAK